MRAVLGNSLYRRNAERLSAEMRAAPGLDQSVGLLEQLSA
jgi:hypothetical protein